MSKFSNNIVSLIKRSKKRPKSKSYFITLHILLWASLVISITLGSIAFAIIIRHLTISDWGLARRISGSHFRSFFILVPYVWFALIAITLFVADHLFKHTKKGYKVRPFYVAIGSIVLSLLGGLLLFNIRADIPLETGLRRHMPYYVQHMEARSRPFVSPEKGVLVGRIKEIDLEKNMLLIDFKENEWFVDISEAEIFENIELEIDMRVGVTGRQTDEGGFKADRIRPWLYDSLHGGSQHFR